VDVTVDLGDHLRAHAAVRTGVVTGVMTNTGVDVGSPAACEFAVTVRNRHARKGRFEWWTANTWPSGNA
jgi:hypothetical protein